MCISKKKTKNRHALPLSLISPVVLCNVVEYVCNCSFLQPSDISTRSWWAGKGRGIGGGVGSNEKKIFDSSQVVDSGFSSLGLPFVFLLALYEGFFEEVGIWQVV